MQRNNALFMDDLLEKNGTCNSELVNMLMELQTCITTWAYSIINAGQE